MNSSNQWSLILIIAFVLCIISSAIYIFDKSDAPAWLQAIGSILLFIITIIYIKYTNDLVKVQLRQNKIQRLRQEMDLVISPLYLHFVDHNNFYAISVKTMGNQQAVLTFWEPIYKNKYLAPNEIWENYEEWNDINGSSSEKSLRLNKFCESINKRYNEIKNELKILEDDKSL